jgi:hypothetical protein
MASYGMVFMPYLMKACLLVWKLLEANTHAYGIISLSWNYEVDERGTEHVMLWSLAENCQQCRGTCFLSTKLTT